MDVKFKKNIPLKKFTTYKIGGPARYFFDAKNKDEIVWALQEAKKSKLNVFILGGGSNLLVSDKGFNGLVIKVQLANYKLQGEKISADAGISLAKLALECANKGLSGLEWASGIPGATLGGAIFGNAQAFGQRMSDVINTVQALDLKTLKIKEFSKQQCKFSLKNSIFKKTGNYVILSAELYLKKTGLQEIDEKTAGFWAHRKNSHPMDFPSAGSVFVNPEMKVKNKKLLEKFPELSGFNEKGVIPAGYLIQKTGLCGHKIGGAQISEKHCNFFINKKNAKAKDVLLLIKLAQKKVKKTFNITLEPEVILVGKI